MRFRSVVAAVVCVTGLLSGTSVFAQLRPIPYLSGLSSPIAFIQDPADPTIQYVVQQGGRIRLIRNGTIEPAPFLDLTGLITTGGEQGLLGMALPADHTATGRFYVNFTSLQGNIVVARFERSTTNPLVADPASRFDLIWSTGQNFIVHPEGNHNGGTLAFGPDGFLYIGTGDGGGGNDPNHNAQNPQSLLGKMLRIDVSVPDGHPTGIAIPADNPFRNTSRPEIWSFGLRNPWKFSFDSPARGGTGAMLIGDVGQGAFEEVDYEPAGRGGRNYGWRNREGAHDTGIIPNLAPAFTPLTDPIFEYGRTAGRSITGGYVYRGSALGAGFRGRYFFGDFVTARIWSIALTVNPASGEATASDLRDHTAELTPGGVSSFGVDAAGELYFVNYSGTIVRIGASPSATAPMMNLDLPRQSQTLVQPFVISGWAIDPLAQTSPGVGAIHIWAYPLSAVGSPASGAPLFVGNTDTGAQRPDVAAFFGGSQFTASGFNLIASGLSPGAYRLAVFGLLESSGMFGVVSTVDVVIVSRTYLSVDAPGPGAVGSAFLVGGWALDASAPSGSGVDAVHVWAVRTTGGPFMFLGATTSFSDRHDVGALFGARFTTSGYNIVVNTLPIGTWDLYVYARSTVTGLFQPSGPVRITR